MLRLADRIEVLAELGNSLKKAEKSHKEGTFYTVSIKAFQQNNWFTEENARYATKVWAETLTKENLLHWVSLYKNELRDDVSEKKIGVINAGNIPFVGLHDLLCVFIAGHKYIGKNSSDDPYLLPFIVDMMTTIEPRLNDRFDFVERLSGMDAVIATGSNNSARYFEYYFKKYPHIIRRNRNAVAVLNGNETNDELQALGEDIFRYFGLGCRNVSKLYVPQGYDFKKFFEPLEQFSAVAQHHKYMNNFDVNNAILLMKQIPFLQNGFLIVREEKQIASPIAIVHYEQYDDISALSQDLDEHEGEIQCVVTNTGLNLKSSLSKRVGGFGEAQRPSLWDYADGIDVLEWLWKSVPL